MEKENNLKQELLKQMEKDVSGATDVGVNPGKKILPRRPI